MNDNEVKIEYAKDLEAILRAFRECRDEYTFEYKNMSEADAETQDILHKLELDESLTYKDRAALGKALTEVRKRRRKAKDANERLEALYVLLNENMNFIKALERVLGEMRKVENRHKNRIYTPRVLNGSK